MRQSDATSPFDSRRAELGHVKGLPKVYFARAIDGENKADGQALASAVSCELGAAGLLMVDPTASEPSELLASMSDVTARYRAIVEHDLSVLRSCNAVLMDMTISTRNYIGCVCEMTYAYLWRIPCVVYLGDIDRNRPWLHYHATAVYGARLDAIAHLRDLLLR
jgi:hypothetical protein